MLKGLHGWETLLEKLFFLSPDKWWAVSGACNEDEHMFITLASLKLLRLLTSFWYLKLLKAVSYHHVIVSLRWFTMLFTVSTVASCL